MSFGEYRAELALYAALSAPMFLSARLSNFDAPLLDLVTNAELLAVNADADCVMATPVRRDTSAAESGGDDRWAVDVWVKPLSDASFVWVLINRDPNTPRNASIIWNDGRDGTDSDIFPALLPLTARVRDVLAQAPLGVLSGGALNVLVPPHDARMIRVFAA